MLLFFLVWLLFVWIGCAWTGENIQKTQRPLEFKFSFVMLVVDTQSKIAQVYLTSFIFRNILFVTHFIFERCGYGGTFLISRILWRSLRRFLPLTTKKWQALTRKSKIKKKHHHQLIPQMFSCCDEKKAPYKTSATCLQTLAQRCPVEQ